MNTRPPIQTLIDNKSSSFKKFCLRENRRKTFSHIINEFVPTRLRKDVLHEHEILGELHRRLIDHQHITTSSTAANSTWDLKKMQVVSLLSSELCLSICSHSCSVCSASCFVYFSICKYSVSPPIHHNVLYILTAMLSVPFFHILSFTFGLLF